MHFNNHISKLDSWRTRLLVHLLLTALDSWGFSQTHLDEQMTDAYFYGKSKKKKQVVVIATPSSWTELALIWLKALPIRAYQDGAQSADC